MPGLPQATVASLRQRLPRPPGQESLAEMAGAVAIVGGAWLLVAVSPWLGRAQLVALAGVLIAVLAVLLRRGWLKLFGPVLFYDLVRVARRGRYALVRFAYATLLFLSLLSVYAGYSGRYGSIPANEIARLGESFFATFMMTQLAAVGLLTPAYAAGAIAEEKDRKTLEFLLATDLRNREIVLGKLTSRLGNLTLLVLTGLPILALTQFLGGVDPDLVLVGFAVTGLTMVSLASLSVAFSVYARRSRDAIVLTYLTMLAYLTVSSLSWALLLFRPVANFQLTLAGVTLTAKDLISLGSAGNLPAAWVRLTTTWTPGVSLADAILPLFGQYAAFHGLLMLVCTTWAVARIRSVAVAQASGPRRPAARRPRVPARRPVGTRPMVWKEVSVEGRLRHNLFSRLVLALIVLVSFIPAVWILAYHWTTFWEYGRSWDSVAQSMNIWVRVAGSGVACVTLLGVAVRAAGAVSGERERQTFDSLLTTTLSGEEMLAGKWLGSVLSVRWGWAWLGAIWGLGMLTGGLFPLALFFLVFAWAVYAGVFAVAGLWFSMTCRTTLRATVCTLLAVLAVSVGHWLAWAFCCLPFGLHNGRSMESVAEFESLALTPPVTLGWLAFCQEDFESRYGQFRGADDPYRYTFEAIIGIVCWAGAGAALWAAAGARFRLLTNRDRPPRPLRQQRPPPPAQPLPEVIPVDDDPPQAPAG